jgi:hypothetical protein
MDLESPVNILSQSQGSISLEAYPADGIFQRYDTQNHDLVELAAGFIVAGLRLGAATGFNGRALINNAAGQSVIAVSGRLVTSGIKYLLAAPRY